MMDYIFYSVIGKHAGESAEQIIERKQKELTVGVSLWSAKIDKKSIEQVWNLNEKDKVYVLCKLNPNAKDPSKERETVSATIMVTPSGEQKIPSGINTTFTKGKSYQAYIVKNYEFLNEAKIYDIGKYETFLADNSVMSFKERFRNSLFQNTSGRKNDQLTDVYEKEISAIMELQYPFVVEIK